MDTAISLVTPFAAYLLAEELHSSGVISVVVAGLLLGHKAPIIQTAQSRIAERINWRTIAFLLENTVFLLIGLQARWILEGVAESELSPRAHHRRVRGRAARPRSCCGWSGCSPRATCWSGPVRTPTAARLPPWQYTLRPRLGRHARRGDAGGGLRHPRGDRAPRGAAAHRLHGGGRHPLHPGPLPAVGRPHACACPRPTRSTTRWPGRRCCSRRPRPASRPSSELETRRPARRLRPDPATGRPAQLRRLGAALHDRRAGVAQRPLRPGPRWR